MDFNAIWEFMNTRAALYVYAVLIFSLFFIHRTLKRKKVKLLMADNRFKDAQLFGPPAITTPIAISIDGYIGVAPGPFSPPVIINMKTIKGYEIFFDDHSIAKSDKVGKNELIFKDTASLMEQRLQEKTKKILLALFLKDDYTLNVVLFNASTRPSSAMRDSTRNEIKQLFSKLEEVEPLAKHH